MTPLLTSYHHGHNLYPNSDNEGIRWSTVNSRFDH
ncbi:unnamed protein product [Acanthoscelides obtectus]|uniref:Uncharacterized protein n=1 Tax=Acanthoscelides obtectus TaxID=200917 RepID=A0A9P0P458_ACAOB|nr:unnamed protein product [Acanthoscelides obtectus]CAK1647278.1 hypothetical protein AOBTE_LOCUS15149 [Acanthoscelides obtectus]